MEGVVLLGPQRFTPTLRSVLDRFRLEGPFALITAGWQEREEEDRELSEHLAGKTINLALYTRAEEVFAGDPELAQGYRERQEALKLLQEAYRIRLNHLQAALRELISRAQGSSLFLPARESALEQIRELDREHLSWVAAVHRRFESQWKVRQRPSVARHRTQLSRILANSSAVLVAGGHVAVLLNRIRLFGLERIMQRRPVVAWSGGAMVVSSRVVLFHHSPPQGYGNTEVLENGLGLARGIVPLPHAERRLALDDPRRIAHLARRFAPDLCITLEDGAYLVSREGRWVGQSPCRVLRPDGSLAEVEAA
jgi:hypothetical protein